MSDLPYPEFVYDTLSGQTIEFMDNVDKKCNFESRKGLLRIRSAYQNPPLLWI